MRIVEKDNIIINFDETNKEDIIENMIRTLNLDDEISKNIKDEIMVREKIDNTVIGFGFAIPHCKTRNIDESRVIYLKSLRPLIWDEEEELVNHVFMIIVPENNAEKHIDILKDISSKILNSEFRNKLNELEDKIEIEQILNS
ncbi:PTS sugar transporter subunit IIA [Streptobacillus notomytis]|uniref:PTS sugar transporter subunit IIA n=1 Tax=Streptobacillus notomytis TaxID=1712031 RepID=UPI00082C3FCC|nr:PTS sugar transporter subunit IIA [Streptobacillus notomytis]